MSDTIYLTTSGTVDTLTKIKAACPAAPLVQPSPGVWELNSDLSGPTATGLIHL
jgi:hypothetical protein